MKPLFVLAAKIAVCAAAGTLSGLLLAWAEAEPCLLARLVLVIAALVIAIVSWGICTITLNPHDDTAGDRLPHRAPCHTNQLSTKDNQ